jgi:hypothetical protein
VGRLAVVKVLAGVAFAVGAATTVAYCTIYSPDLVPEIEGGSGIGWWSGGVDAGGQTCFSAKMPTPADRPPPGDTTEIPPIYLAVGTMRIGSQDPNFQPDSGAWEDLGMDIDGVCTNSPTCDLEDSVSCKPTVPAIPYDGNYCRDNTFGRLEVQAASIPEVGTKYGLNDDAFNCALCSGAYNFIIRISNYNGAPDDDSVRVDLYPSPGLETVLPWNCQDPSWRVHPCFTADMPWLVRDTAVTADAGGPDLPNAVLADPNAYVRSGYIVAELPPDTLFWFPTIPGRKADVATAFPLKLTQAVVTGQVTKAEDGTWSIVDGTIAGRSRETDIIEGFRLIGFCESDPNYSLMQGFLHGSLDVLANGQNDPNTTCDAVSVGIAFTARQATAGGLIHVDDLVECPAGDAGTDGGADAGDAGADAADGSADATGD